MPCLTFPDDNRLPTVASESANRVLVPSAVLGALPAPKQSVRGGRAAPFTARVHVPKAAMHKNDLFQ